MAWHWKHHKYSEVGDSHKEYIKEYRVYRTTVTEPVRLGKKTPTDSFADALTRKVGA